MDNSKLFERCSAYTSPDSDSEDVRILHGQKTGHKFREAVGDAAAVTLAALVAIREERIKSGSPDKPADATAFLLNQLKHPKEVELLRIKP